MATELNGSTPPELEVLCPKCKGTGGETYQDGRDWCYDCNGAGYIPTAFGRAVLDLIRRNFHHLSAP